MPSFTNADISAETGAEAEEIRPTLRVELPKGLTLRPRDERGRQTVFRPREELKCFVAAEWRQLGDIIVDYRWFFRYSQQLELKLHERQLEVGRLEVINDAHVQERARLEKSVEFHAQLFRHEHQLRLADAASRAKRERLLWIGGGSLLVLDVVLMIVLIAR